MEDVLDVYHRPYDERFPVVAMDEKPVQLVADVRDPLPAAPGGVPRRRDHEYQRNGTANVFCAFEPLGNWRRLTVTDRRTRVDWAHFVRDLVDDPRYAAAERLVLVMDQLNTHALASLYAAFEPAEARRIAARLEVHHTPKHGSWLNVAEVELSVFGRRLPERVGDAAGLAHTCAAYERDRNASGAGVTWRFTTDHARIKLGRLYPSIEGS
jgi:DDE superfamily endonuclease